MIRMGVAEWSRASFASAARAGAISAGETALPTAPTAGAQLGGPASSHQALQTKAIWEQLAVNGPMFLLLYIRG